MSMTTFEKAPPRQDGDAGDGLRTEFLDGLVGYRLRLASNAFMSEFAAAMTGAGMRAVQVSILSVVQENPGVRQGEIGRALGVARANMAPLMAELEAARLLRRVTDETDRRAVSVHLTKNGEALLKNCKARIEAHERRALQAFSRSEKETLLRLLKKI
ncbi:MAG: MarR family transcriptional regulator [Oricola sp.]|jgi:DNA-binding MarR family transcriptional regulator|nr:MarR family transcriptional regulator [Oricola sp.]